MTQWLQRLQWFMVQNATVNHLKKKKNQVDESDKKVKFQFNEKHSMINEKIFTFHWQTHL